MEFLKYITLCWTKKQNISLVVHTKEAIREVIQKKGHISITDPLVYGKRHI